MQSSCAFFEDNTVAQVLNIELDMSNGQEKITLVDHVVFQPKGFSWVTEVDIASLENKQYIRKSYQSTMDIAKDLQYDADVLETPSLRPKGEKAALSAALSQGGSNQDLEKQITTEIMRESEPDKQRKLSEKKDPPPKPPRISKLSIQPSHLILKEPDLLAISSPRIVMSPPDKPIPSVMEAGSRVSTFGHNSSFSRPRGHTRSKSESVKLDKATTRDANSQSRSAVDSHNSRGDRRSKTINNPLLIPNASRPKTPTPPRTPHGYQEREQQKRSFKRNDSKEGNSRCKGNARQEKTEVTQDLSQLRSGTPDKGKKYLELGSNVQKRRSEGCLLDGKVSPVAKDQYNQIVMELNSSINLNRTQVDENDHRKDCISQSVFTGSNQSRDGLPDKENLQSQTCPESKDAGVAGKSIVSQDGEEKSFQKPHSSFSAKSQVRKSMFISHDEEDSILEDKPLSTDSGGLSAQGLGTVDDAHGLGAKRCFPSSPRCLSPDQGSGTHSDKEESTFSDDTEGSTSTLPCLGIGSFHYKELKKSLDSDKWLATNDDEGKIYYYEESGTNSQWKLPELDVGDDLDGKDGLQTSTLESQRVSLVTESLTELSKSIVKEGFLHRTFIMKEGKKVRKNWTNSYARYIVSSFNSGSSGLIHFSKTKDDDKKAEIFDFIPTCSLDLSNDKKTSRQQVIGLRNGHNTEVLLQFEDKDIATEWYRVLVNHDGIQENVTPVAEKEEKKWKKGTEKMRRAASVEQLAPDSKGITDKLLNFIKRRPLKETLEKKGIYKEAVFGSTLSELHQQDKTMIPIFVLQCINHIEKSEENLRTDGLYRISGNAAQIQKIRYEVAQRNYTILSREKEVHNLSGALKLFFRELKEPLIPFANYQDFIQATGSEYRKKNQQVEKLAKAVRQLPSENFETVKLLLQHLLRVSEYESENRMSISNLAIVFGPCLLWPKVTNAHDLMTDVMLHNRVIEGLLSDYAKIFASRR